MPFGCSFGIQALSTTTPNQGEVKILIPFTNPVIVGKFVYHCHIMEHEDAGMMAVIQVRDPSQANAEQLAGGLFGADDICVSPTYGPGGNEGQGS